MENEAPQPAPPGTTTPSPHQQTVNPRTALDYLSDIKAAYTDQPDVYKAFLDLLGEVTRTG